MLRGYKYLFECGYYRQFAIDRIYIDVDNNSAIYSIIGYMGFAGIIILSNIFSYYLIMKKQMKLVISLFLFEVVLFFGATFKISKIMVYDVVIDILRFNNIKDYLYLFFLVVVIVLTLNLCGIVLFVFRKKELQNNENVKIRLKISEIMLSFLIVCLAVGFFAYFSGVGNANRNKDFKTIVEEINANEKEKIEENRILSYENKEVCVYPILYEDKDIYIISYLCRNENNDNLSVDVNHQKIITKRNIKTVYVDDVDIFLDKENQGNVDDSKEQDLELKSSKGSDKKMETIIGVIVGGVIGFLGTYLNEKVKFKRERQHASSMLYYDLKSVEDYFKNQNITVNLRYFNDWQTILSRCSFLTDSQIRYVYKLYDEIYNFNFYYCKKSNRKQLIRDENPVYENLCSLIFQKEGKKIKKLFYNNEYNQLIENLRKNFNN